MSTLDSIAEDFQLVDDDMRIELLLDYARQLPPLAEAYHPLRDRGLYMIHECQSPVFLMVEVNEDTVHLHADVPEEAPMARSFVAMMVQAFDGVAAQAVREAPEDILAHLCIRHLIGMQRTRGLTAIYQRIKSDVARLSSHDSA